MQVPSSETIRFEQLPEIPVSIPLHPVFQKEYLHRKYVVSHFLGYKLHVPGWGMLFSHIFA